ncbi:MAG: hypothetical protein J2P36_12855 [Ktedonobacteraceae bacterium]|nr:hypothetical protein [Ktedonobacteraceae bacterium]
MEETDRHREFSLPDFELGFSSFSRIAIFAPLVENALNLLQKRQNMRSFGSILLNFMPIAPSRFD